MIKNESTRDELKRISSELYAMGQRIKGFSMTVDGDKMSFEDWNDEQ